MQHSDNDMDELFRKAAEKYPLKTDAGSWNDITPFVANAIGLEKPGQNKRLTGMLFLVSAILTLSFLGVFIEHFPHRQDKKAELPVLEHQLSQPAAGVNSPGENHNAGRSMKTQKTAIGYPVNTKQISTLAKYKNYVNINLAGYNSFKKLEYGKTEDLRRRQLVGYTADKIATMPDSTSFSVFQTKKAFAEKLITAVPSLGLPQAKFIENKKSIFYFGLEAGLQLNQVKGQGFNKAGFSASLTAGLQFNKKLSVETGITWSEKHFYTDGKYFDMRKAGSGMPVNMTVLSLNSCSNIFEIPVLVKYNIARNKSKGWFITAGMSSYILTKETNDYLALINGQQQSVQGEYTISKNYFSAVVQFGAGYEYKIRKQTALRIEPYIQIPIKGIGIGSVQVMTTGFHLGFIKYTNR